MGEERRRAVRIKSKLFVQYCLDINSADKKWDITTVRNISETGACILTSLQFEKNSTIALRLKIPSRPFETIEIYGRVVDSESFSHGETFVTRIEFKDLRPDILFSFREYVDWVIKNEQK
jgi:c-di-GMP-binding flagellar brake protein YcgR